MVDWATCVTWGRGDPGASRASVEVQLEVQWLQFQGPVATLTHDMSPARHLKRSIYDMTCGEKLKTWNVVQSHTISQNRLSYFIFRPSDLFWWSFNWFPSFFLQSLSSPNLLTSGFFSTMCAGATSTGLVRMGVGAAAMTSGPWEKAKSWSSRRRLLPPTTPGAWPLEAKRGRYIFVGDTGTKPEWFCCLPKHCCKRSI